MILLIPINSRSHEVQFVDASGNQIPSSSQFFDGFLISSIPI